MPSSQAELCVTTNEVPRDGHSPLVLWSLRSRAGRLVQAGTFDPELEEEVQDRVES